MHHNQSVSFSVIGGVSGEEFMGLDNSAHAELATQEYITSINKKNTRKRIVVFIVVSIINIALLFLLFTQLLTPANNQTRVNTLNTTNASNTAMLGDIIGPQIGKPAPDFTLSVLGKSGSLVHLADFKGKPLILNFWASWCGPCNDEAPFLQKAWPGLQAQGITLIGVNSGADWTSHALEFTKKYGISYPNLQDSLTSDTAINYSSTGFPETVFINKDGIVVAKWGLPLTQAGLQLEVAKLSRPLK